MNIPDFPCRLLIPLAFVVMGGLAGCKKYVPPEIHWKTDPGERYAIRLQLDSPAVRNASSVKGIAQYVVSNFTECMATDHGVALGGFKHEPIKMVDLAVTRVSSDTFVTSAYKNPLVDEDYYGLGTCTWVLRSVEITFDGLFGRVAASLGNVYAHPGRSDLLCNETTGFCDLAQYADEPARARGRFTQGYVVINGE